MAKKSLTKKSLKSLFSKSEASLNAPAEKNEVEKKKFKFFKLKTKSKSGSVPEKPTNESPQARRYVPDARCFPCATEAGLLVSSLLHNLLLLQSHGFQILCLQ